MNINPCIFDKDGNIVGCITDSSIKTMEQQYYDLYKAFQNTEMLNLLNFMFKSLMKSKENNSAEFLNVMKILMNKYRYKLPKNFAKKLSFCYYNCVKYCSSNVVYDEVLQETISFFREHDIEYKGKDVQGVGDDEYAFDYDGMTVGIKFKNANDLYSFWKKENAQYNAIIYTPEKLYLLAPCEFYDDNRQILCMGIKGCVDDYRKDNEKKEIAEQIFEIAEKLKGLYE